jgi:hypothetical protein
MGLLEQIQGFNEDGWREKQTPPCDEYTAILVPHDRNPSLLSLRSGKLSLTLTRTPSRPVMSNL